MTIRRALWWLVLAVLTPVLLAAVVSLVSLYRAQHAAQGERMLERVRALRIALDVEIGATERMLATVGERSQLRQDRILVTPDLVDGLQRLAQSNDMWAAAMLVEADGRESLRAERRGAGGAPHPRPPGLDAATLQAVIQTGKPQLSGLVGEHGGPLYTFVAAPVLVDGRVLRVVCIAVPQQAWLAFLARLPVDPQATLTLNDGQGRIVARTRDNDVWAGRSSLPEYWERTRLAQEAFFANRSLEGVAFVSAFSRLAHGGWVLGTGVPADAVNRAVWSQAGLLGGLLMAAVAAALLGALWLGRRITAALQELAALASSGGGPAHADGVSGHALPLAEVQAVRQVLREAFEKQVQARDQADRTRMAREQFVATLAHELRNPLGAIQHAALLIEHERIDAEGRRKAVSILKRQVAQLARLMDDLFEASRPAQASPSLHLAELDLARICTETLEALNADHRLSHVTLHTDLPSVHALGDGGRLQQVVANLLGNAAKFTPAGGSVTLTLARQASHAVITVSDTGKGIGPALLERIFEPFQQGQDNDVSGLGLGLHVVRRIVELHGGTVHAFSAGEGQGTTVTVRLPVSGPQGRAAGA